MDDLKRTVLDSGVRVLTESMPQARSVSAGCWVGVGSRDEPSELAGASHFCEHLLFKGTEDRQARAIAMSVEALGGEMNAYTAREQTAYHLRLPGENASFGIELLCDVVSAPAFRPDEIDCERDVIVEEILMAEDTADDVAITALWESVFDGHPLGLETLGSRDSIEAMTREGIVGFHRRWYTPSNVVVAVAGDVDHDRVVGSVEQFMAGLEPGAPPVREAPGNGPAPRKVIARPGEQAHVALGWRGLDLFDEDRFALWVANHLLGGGTSSRLFQEIRESRGLAYSVYSSPAMYSDSGIMTVYAATVPESVDEVLDVVDGVIEDLVTNGPRRDEFDVAVGYLVGSTLLGLEDSASRMARLGEAETRLGEVPPVEVQIEALRSVTPDDVRRVLTTVLSADRSLVIVGPFEPDDPRFSNR